jgi:hypothetical protein
VIFFKKKNYLFIIIINFLLSNPNKIKLLNIVEAIFQICNLKKKYLQHLDIT